MKGNTTAIATNITDPGRRNFYTRIRKRVMDWLKKKGVKSHYAEFIASAPDFFYLLCMLIADKRVDIKHKGMMLLAAAYFASPIDLLPEALFGPIGYLDDISLTVYVLNQFVNSGGEQLLRTHWPGKDDVLEKIQSILYQADQLLGTGLWAKVMHIVDAWKKDPKSGDAGETA